MFIKNVNVDNIVLKYLVYLMAIDKFTFGYG